MSRPDTSGFRGLFLPVLSGLLLALAYPPADLGPLAFLALVPLLLSLRAARRGAALLRGYACGAAFFFVLLDWIPRVMVLYGGLSWPLGILILALLVAYLAGYFALFAFIVAAACRRHGPQGLLMAPIAWVGLEFIRGRALTGFPWGLLGYSQYRNLALLQAATLGGIYAVSFLVMALNTALALLATRPAPVRARAAGLLSLLLVVAVHAGGAVALWRGERALASGGERITVAAVQGNVPQDSKWDPAAATRIVTDLVRLTREAARGGASLVVWPESASPYSFNRPRRVRAGETEPAREAGGLVVEPDRPYVDLVTGLAHDLGITLIAGSVDYRVAGGRLGATNSAFAVAPDGSISAPYDKVHLVPFGEYVPLRGVLFFVDRLVRGAIADFAPGTSLAPLPTPMGPAATFICYEAILPDVVRPIVRRGAVLLVNITNDGWYGRSPGPPQHLAMAVARAVENRRYLVRAANTGISAIVDPYGRITRRTRLLEQTVLVGVVAPRSDVTPYGRSGDLLAWGCAILLLLDAALRAASSRLGGRSPARE